MSITSAAGFSGDQRTEVHAVFCGSHVFTWRLSTAKRAFGAEGAGETAQANEVGDGMRAESALGQSIQLVERPAAVNGALPRRWARLSLTLHYE